MQNWKLFLFMLHHFKQLLPAPILPHPKYLLKNTYISTFLIIFKMKKPSKIHVGYYAQKEAGTKVLASQLFLDCRARRSG